MIQSSFPGVLLSRLVGPTMKIVIPLANNILLPLGLIASASAPDAGIHKKNSQIWSNTNNVK